ncbi:MAG: secondary thiamine-phosphate synthase enzyme YjbQ [Eubacteriales bacterium]
MYDMEIATNKRCQMIDITKRLSTILEESKVEEGVMTVFIPHTTAGVTINENGDPDVRKDILHQLEKISPQSEEFNHFEGNSDAHVKSSLVGCSAQVIIKDGSMCLGTWQSVYFCEFDGPRHRKIWVYIK